MGAANEATDFQYLNFAIPAGVALSTANENLRKALVGLIMPAVFDGTTITFQVSRDNVTYLPVYDKAGSPYSVSVGINRRVILPPGDVCGFEWIKIVSSSNETAARTVIGVFRAV